MQEFIYHMVPNQMVGDKLIPLNSLKTTYPYLYEKYTKKYLDHPERSKLLQRCIPRLNCLWNDVIHLLPIHPHYNFNTLSNLGIKTKEEVHFYKIPIGLISATRFSYLNHFTYRICIELRFCFYRGSASPISLYLFLIFPFHSNLKKQKKCC